MNVEFDYVRPTLYPKQFSALYDPRRYSVIEASTKAGKTSAGIIWLTEKAVRAKDGQNFWWVAPVSFQADVAFRRLRRGFDPELMSVHLQLKTVTFWNGTVIWFKSGDNPDSLYGDDVYAAVIDEASRFKEDAWHAVRSTLTKTQGPVRIIGNVKGRKNWFYQLARLAEKADDPTMGYHKLTAVDAIEAGVIPAEEVEDARRRLPERVFKELYMAEAAYDEGNPFGYDQINQCIAPLSTDAPMFWGWDLAKSVDYTVGIGLDAKGRVCKFERFQKVPWRETVDRIKKVTGRARALVDSTGVGDPIAEELARAGSQIEGFKFTNQSKQQLMEGLAMAISGQSVNFPEGPIAIELRQFEYNYLPGGAVRYQAQEGAHDDCVCALALAWMAKSKRKYNYDSSMAWVA